MFIRRRGVVGWVPAFQPGGPGSIPGGDRNFNSYPGLGYVSSVFCPVLSPAEALTLGEDLTFREARPCVSVYSLWGATWEKIFKRDTKCVYPLSLLWCWRHWCYPLFHFCERDSGGLFHCGVTTNFIFILTIHISMGGSPGDVSEEPVT